VEIVCVGRLVASKGQMLLLQAILNLIQKGHHIRLTLVGDGPSRGLLQKFAKSNGIVDAVHFAGPCAHEETQAYLAQADIFVLPSLAEGLPVALMEAMASQLPCVSTYVGGIPELITNEVDGLLVASSSISKLTEALDLLASDPKLRGRLGEAARQKVLQGYRLQENVRKLAALFEEQIPRALKEPGSRG
jgi:glycosyltransferase involved in cell wall biosynthesis